MTYGSGPGSAFASANLTNGQAYTHQFAAAGTYVVYCTIHGSPTSGMRATVVVQ